MFYFEKLLSSTQIISLNKYVICKSAFKTKKYKFWYLVIFKLLEHFSSRKFFLRYHHVISEARAHSQVTLASILINFTTFHIFINTALIKFKTRHCKYWFLKMSAWDIAQHHAWILLLFPKIECIDMKWNYCLCLFH